MICLSIINFTSPVQMILLCLTSIIAAIVDTLGGGGGLVTLPVLFMMGFPPAVVLGTNRLQACVGECSAAIYFMRHGRIQIKDLMTGFLFTMIGSTAGSISIQYIQPGILNKFIPFLLLAIFLYMVFLGKLIQEKPKQRLSTLSFYLIFGSSIGFYNGFLGPGTGSFWVIALMFFLGYDLKKATLYGKPLNFSGDFASLICFMIIGAINYRIALVMSVGQLIGTRVGATLVIHKGTKIIRPVFITMAFIMTVCLFIKYYAR